MFSEENFFVGYHFVDSRLRLKNTALLCMFEDVAGMHSIAAGESIKTAPTTWLLTAYKIDVIQRPEYGERITVRTWCREAKHFFSVREFEVINESGEKIITAFSEWVHIDRSEGRLKKCTPELEAAYEPESDYTNYLFKRLTKLNETNERVISESCQEVTKALIDANDHMNNVYYLELAEAALSDRYSKELFDRFEINYRKAFKQGEKVICRCREGVGGVLVSMLGEDESLRAIISMGNEQNDK